MGAERQRKMGGDPLVWIAIIIVASLIEMWAAASICDSHGWGNGCRGEYAFAVAVGAASLGICIIMTILHCACNACSQKAHPFISVLMWLLWGAGVGVCTFGVPFRNACGFSVKVGNVSVGSSGANGYFSTWICFIASCFYVFESVPQIKGASDKVTSGSQEKGWLLVIFLASVCELWAAAYVCDNTYSYSWAGHRAGCYGLAAWGVSCGAISAFLALLFAFVPQLQGFIKWVALFLALWWAAGVATLTFTYRSTNDIGGMFTSAGNGYFGTWVAFFASFILAYSTLVPGGGGLPSASGMDAKQ